MSATRENNVQDENKAIDTALTDNSKKKRKRDVKQYDAQIEQQASKRLKFENVDRAKRLNNFRLNRILSVEDKLDLKSEVQKNQKDQTKTPKPKPEKLVDYVSNPPNGFGQFQFVRSSPSLNQFCWYTKKPSSIQTNLNTRYIQHVGGRNKFLNNKNNFRKDFKEVGLCIRGRGNVLFLMQDAVKAESQPFFQNPKEGYEIADAFFKFYFPNDKLPTKEEIEEFKKTYSLTKDEDKEAYKAYQIVTNTVSESKKQLVGATPKLPKFEKKPIKKHNKNSSDYESESDFSDHPSDFVSSSKSKPKSKKTNKKNELTLNIQPELRIDELRADVTSSNSSLTNAAVASPVSVQATAEIPAIVIPETVVPAKILLTIPEEKPVNPSISTAGIQFALSKVKSHKGKRKRTASESVTQNIQTNKLPNKKQKISKESNQIEQSLEVKQNTLFSQNTFFKCKTDEFILRMFLRNILGSNNQRGQISEQQGYHFIECYDVQNAIVKQKEYQTKAALYRLNIVFAIRPDMPNKLLLLSSDNNQVSISPESSQRALEKLKQLNQEANLNNEKAMAEAKQLAEEDKVRMRSISLVGVR